MNLKLNPLMIVTRLCLLNLSLLQSRNKKSIHWIWGKVPMRRVNPKMSTINLLPIVKLVSLIMTYWTGQHLSQSWNEQGYWCLTSWWFTTLSISFVLGWLLQLVVNSSSRIKASMITLYSRIHSSFLTFVTKLACSFLVVHLAFSRLSVCGSLLFFSSSTWSSGWQTRSTSTSPTSTFTSPTWYSLA